MTNQFYYDDTSILLVKVNDGIFRIFQSALDKQEFIRTHKSDTYFLSPDGNCVTENLYIAIDTDGTGWVLNPKKALPYYEVVDLINHYL